MQLVLLSCSHSLFCYVGFIDDELTLYSDELALNSLDSLAIGTSTVSVIVLATSLGFCGVAVVLVCFRKVKGHRKTGKLKQRRQYTYTLVCWVDG